MAEFGIRKALRATYDEALSNVPAALGACNPPFAHEALQAELEIGLMLPCNVVVYEDDGGRAVVLAIDPTKTMAGTGNAKLAELAAAVKEKRSRALARLE